MQTLLDLERNDCEIERETGVPRRTVLDWRHGKGLSRPRPASPGGCRRCVTGHDFEALGGEYVYLLGVYLGDGYIVRHKRGNFQLRTFCSADHPQILLHIARALEAIFPEKRAHWYLHPEWAMVILSMYSTEWPCLFPQYGPGMKHSREIALSGWQQRLVERHPEELLRGLIHSDGCRSLNTIKHPKRTYVYPRYQFSNRSMDIHGIFTDACDQLGVEWRWMNQWTISVAKRPSVARLDEFIGPKR